jgi:hypothetical protein
MMTKICEAGIMMAKIVKRDLDGQNREVQILMAKILKLKF